MLNSACLSWVANHNYQTLTIQIHIHIILLKTYFNIFWELNNLTQNILHEEVLYHVRKPHQTAKPTYNSTDQGIEVVFQYCCH